MKSNNRPLTNPERAREARASLVREGDAVAILHDVPDAIVAVDNARRVTFWNAAAERLLGAPAASVLGKSLDELGFEPVGRSWPRMEASQPFLVDTVWKHADRARRLTLNGAPIQDGSAVQGVALVVAETAQMRDERGNELVSLVDSSTDAIIGKRLDSIITTWNPAAETLFGWSAAEMIGNSVSILYPQSRIGEEAQIIKRVARGEHIRHYQTQRVRKDGALIDVSLSVSPIRGHGGRIIGVSSIVRDIGEQKAAEESLKKASIYARSLIEASLDPLVTISPEGKITDVNRATEAVTGVGRKRLVSSDFADYFTDPAKAREGYQKAFSEGIVTDYPLAIRHADGRITHVLYNATVYRDEAGTVQGVFAAARDITERKEAEEKVKKASNYARSLIEASLDPLVTIAPDGKITDVNTATEKVTGVAREKLIGSDFSDYFTEPDKARAGYKKAFSEGVVTDYPLALRKADGGVVHVLYNATVYEDENGNVQGVFAAARDVTSRRNAENDLRGASEYARSLIEASLDPLVTISTEGKITDVNRATELITGLGRKKLIGSDFSDYFTEPEKARAGYKQVFQEGVVRDYPLTLRHVSGRTTSVLYNASVYRDENGVVQGIFAAARDITEREKAEQALKKASNYARSLIEASLDPLVTINTEGKITDVNKATEVATGLPREKLIGSDFSDYFTEPEKAREGYKRVFQEGIVKDYPLALRHHSGPIAEVVYNATVYEDDRGNIQGVFAAARDITERKKAENALKSASDYARSLIEASLDPLVTINTEGQITDVNKATEVVTGAPRETLIGSDFSDYFVEPEKAREGYQRVFQQGAVTDYPLAIRHSSGRVTNVLYNATVYRDEEGRVQGVFAAARDITQQRKAEEAQRKASAYARSLIEASLDPLVTISAEGKITDVNSATEKATGISRSLLIGSDFSDYFVEPDKAREGYLRAFQEGSVTDYPLALRQANGRITHVLYNATVYRDEDGKVQGVFAAARDVTEQRKTDAELRRASRYARSLIEASLDPLVTINTEGKITDVNKATEAVTGLARDQLIGSDFADYFTDPEKAREGYKRAFQEGTVTDYALAIRGASGKVTHVTYNATVYRDEEGNVQGVFAAARDTTTRKASEDALQEKSSELARSNSDLEHFAYVASHDLKEPLRMVSSYVRLLEQKYKGQLDAKADQYIAFAVEGSARMQQLIDGLLEYSRVGAHDDPLEPVPLQAVVEEACSNLQVMLQEKGAKVEVGELGTVRGDRRQLVQVMQNLVSNAIKFQPAGQAPYVRIAARREQNSRSLVVFVADNGIGIDPEYHEQLFTLFRRLHSRDEYAGSGIGLAVCKRIIERHGGRIWIESTPEKGATFMMTLQEERA